MKTKSYLLLAVFALFSTTSVVAGGPGDSPLAARAKTMTQQIAAKTHLNEGQYLKVKQLNLQMLTAVESLKKQRSLDAEAADKQMAEIQDHYEWDLAAILWPRQMVAYKEAKASMTAVNLR
ncbi:hypothetical protein H8B15_02095 [Hymenobacter sp. BT507]|uniref:DUF4168 domain-containing protein n=1 Tax=Hymenobacter citatus TaxID=2763506 RepID=A0ABR7MF40_9BACT|nr:hypothetical protein [Hymenobacter citatus]MBC6609695.1 hypothetical protein [Hymenobacter citatus]